MLFASIVKLKSFFEAGKQMRAHNVKKSGRTSLTKVQIMSFKAPIVLDCAGFI